MSNISKVVLTCLGVLGFATSAAFAEAGRDDYAEPLHVQQSQIAGSGSRAMAAEYSANRQGTSFRTLSRQENELLGREEKERKPDYSN